MEKFYANASDFDLWRNLDPDLPVGCSASVEVALIEITWMVSLFRWWKAKTNKELCIKNEEMIILS